MGVSVPNDSSLAFSYQYWHSNMLLSTLLTCIRVERAKYCPGSALALFFLSPLFSPIQKKNRHFFHLRAILFATFPNHVAISFTTFLNL